MGIDLKTDKGSGRRTCLCGILDNIHYIQAYLNTVYKQLGLIGVPSLKVRDIHALVEEFINGIKQEIPDLFVSGEIKGQFANNLEFNQDDSDEELFKRNTQKQKGQEFR